MHNTDETTTKRNGKQRQSERHLAAAILTTAEWGTLLYLVCAVVVLDGYFRRKSNVLGDITCYFSLGLLFHPHVVVVMLFDKYA